MSKRFILLAVAILLILLVCILYYLSQGLRRTYRSEAARGLERTGKSGGDILTEKDMQHLPPVIQKYLTYVGAVGKEKVRNFRVTFKGEMRQDQKSGWMQIRSEQYNFLDEPTRLFYIKGKMKGVPVLGLHSYTKESAYMHIKVLGLIPVLNAHGPEMRISDTTTLFNDMSFMAPPTLIDPRIQWEPVDELSVKATYECYGTKVSAVLYFNKEGQLINFISNDRYMTYAGHAPTKEVWVTPVKDYKDFNGRKVVTYADAIWQLADGDFTYARFRLQNVEYNLKEFK